MIVPTSGIYKLKQKIFDPRLPYNGMFCFRYKLSDALYNKDDYFFIFANDIHELKFFNLLVNQEELPIHFDLEDSNGEDFSPIIFFEFFKAYNKYQEQLNPLSVDTDVLIHPRCLESIKWDSLTVKLEPLLNDLIETIKPTPKV